MMAADAMLVCEGVAFSSVSHAFKGLPLLCFVGPPLVSSFVRQHVYSDSLRSLTGQSLSGQR
jgi:hypothetical protein